MDNIGDDEIRLLDHPLVAVADREALRHALDSLREDGVGVVSQSVFVPLLRHICKDDAVFDRVTS